MESMLFVLSLALISCEKLIMPKSESADPVKVFDTLWQTIGQFLSKPYIKCKKI